MNITTLKRCLILLTVTLSTVIVDAAEKSIYIPSSMKGSNLNSTSSQWCYARSKQSDDFIVFWEAGYGANPDTVSSSSYRVSTANMLSFAEKCFRFYTDSLKFMIPGSSKTDQYKMIIRLHHSTTWSATGSGEDDVIGVLDLSASAAQAGGSVVAHEVGHCFQYQVHCDGFPGGWMYGLGDNGAGGNCWWEQCAQWQAYKVFPSEQFSTSWFGEYLTNCHKHILSEGPRYSNYFIQDYWTYLHGMDFIAKLWQQSKYPEDPVDAYLRLNKINQSKFNDEIYDCASRFVTWDIPALRDKGASYVNSRAQCKLNKLSTGYWRIDSTQCVENYGYNVIQLNVPSDEQKMTAYFAGLNGLNGFRHKNPGYAGWRYGFVALLKDGTRVYSGFGRPSFVSPSDTLSWTCPANCSRLWLIVSGAPRVHWHHLWDDNDANDEQWPYQVKFAGTNVLGNYDFSDTDVAHSDTLYYDVAETPFTGSASSVYPYTSVSVDVNRVCSALRMQLSEYKSAFGNSVKYAAVTPSGAYNYTSTANAPGHWFNASGYVVNWGSSARIFSEFDSSSLSFRIGQYPNLCKIGNQFTIRQALVYTPSIGSQVKVLFVFRVKIASATGVRDLTVSPSLQNVQLYNLNGVLLRSATNVEGIDFDGMPHGIYIIRTNGISKKIIK
jgi:hypothetical protein